MIKTWAVIFFYFGGNGLQSIEVRGISTESACKTMASQFIKIRPAAGFDAQKTYGYCYQIVEANPQMQIIFPEESKVEK